MPGGLQRLPVSLRSQTANGARLTHLIVAVTVKICVTTSCKRIEKQAGIILPAQLGSKGQRWDVNRGCWLTSWPNPKNHI